MIRQFREATRPASAVTFFDASGTKCGPGSGTGLSSDDVFPPISDVSRLIDCGGGTGEACSTATIVPSATAAKDSVTATAAAATASEFLEMSTTSQKPDRKKKHGPLNQQDFDIGCPYPMKKEKNEAITQAECRQVAYRDGFL